MTLAAGDQAPDFELPDQTGTPRKLSTMLADGPVVLFWYPAAMTTGCTKEACHFRDIAAELEAVGAQRVGTSADQPAQRADLLCYRRKACSGIDDSRCADHKEEVAGPQGLIAAAQVFLPERFPKPDDMRPEQSMT